MTEIKRVAIDKSPAGCKYDNCPLTATAICELCLAPICARHGYDWRLARLRWTKVKTKGKKRSIQKSIERHICEECLRDWRRYDTNLQRIGEAPEGEQGIIRRRGSHGLWEHIRQHLTDADKSTGT